LPGINVPKLFLLNSSREMAVIEGDGGLIDMKSKARKPGDILHLILTALACFGIMLSVISFVTPRVSREWARFIYSILSYLMVLTYTQFKVFSQRSKGKVVLFIFTFYTFTTGIAFFVFKSGLLPLPKRIVEYLPAIVGLPIGSLFVQDYLRLHSDFFKKNSKNPRKKTDEQV
jgi:hypothetical protein